MEIEDLEGRKNSGINGILEDKNSKENKSGTTTYSTSTGVSYSIKFIECIIIWYYNRWRYFNILLIMFNFKYITNTKLKKKKKKSKFLNYFQNK